MDRKQILEKELQHIKSEILGVVEHKLGEAYGFNQQTLNLAHIISEGVRNQLCKSDVGCLFCGM